MNFVQFTVIGGNTSPVSDNLNWFARQSVIKTATGDQLLNDVAGDNQARTGSTNLTLNLQ